MMRAIKSIGIPQPCHQDWQQMTPTAQGRHCQSCCKTVVDFTLMSNAEAITYLATHKNTCGRVEDGRMAGINYELELNDKRQLSWKGWLAAASFGMLFQAVNVQAQVGPAIGLVRYNTGNRGKVVVSNNAGLITVAGNVTAKEDGQPMPDVSISVKGTSTGTKTAADGSFKLRALNRTDTLLITSIGYKAAEVPVSTRNTNLNIILEIAPTVLNDVIIERYSVTPRRYTVGDVVTITGKKIPFYLRWWYWLMHQAKHIVTAVNPF